MDAAYLKAAVPEPFTILGKALKPFSLGHEILFQRFGNRFSIENDITSNPAQIDDLLLGVYICARRYVNTPTLDGFRVPFRVRMAGRIFGERYFSKALERFGDYIKSHTSIPDFYTKSKGDDDAIQEIGAPTIQSVKVSLMSNLGLSEDEALNTQVSLAFWNHLTWLEGQGGIQIIDEAEMKRQEEARIMAEENEARLMAIKAKYFPNGYNPDGLKHKEEVSA